MESVKWLYHYVSKYKKMLFLGLTLTTLVAVLSLVTPYISGELVDRVIEQEHYELLSGMAFLLVGATILKGLFRAAYLMVYESTSQNIIYDVKDAVYRKLLRQDFDFYSKNRAGDLLSRQTGDMDAIRRFFAYTLYAAYENALLFVTALFMIFTVNVKLACCMMAVLPFTAFATVIQMKKVHPVYKNIRNHFSSLNTFTQENISGNRIVKAFAKEEYEKEKFASENNGYMQAELANAKLTGIFIPVFEFLSNLLLIILMLVGGIMVIRGSMTVGNLVTVNGYLWMLNNPLRMAGWLVNDVQHMIASIEKIYATISVEPHIKTINFGNSQHNIMGNVEFKNVSCIIDDEEILHHISFSVKQGETVGIIGATGSGKTTIMNLLCRFIDASEGEVLVDGMDVKQMDLHQLRDHIGMAMQEVFLFSDTIVGNISYGRPNCSLEEVMNVAKMADAHQFIEETPDGYNTIVGERGMGLSGGQKQRISLARALLKKPAILILDDTTSAVDMETERLIQTEIKKIQKEITVFIIASRISSIIDADQIFVLSDGKLAEQGTHETLLKQNGYYASVFHHQYQDFEKLQDDAVKPEGRNVYGEK